MPPSEKQKKEEENRKQICVTVRFATSLPYNTREREREWLAPSDACRSCIFLHTFSDVVDVGQEEKNIERSGMAAKENM